MTVRFGSVCSGIESASVAWEPLGMTPVWFSEIEPFPCAVLAYHWPNVHNLGDMMKLRRRIDTGMIRPPEVLVGGTPCQAYSVAGKRQGLCDPRGQLTLEYVEVLDAIDRQRAARGEPAAVCVWENVPGVLSSKDNAFGCFLGDLAGEDCELVPSGKKWTNAGYVSGPKRTVAWRILDAQYFGVAQRRRRVFVVASARDDFDPRKVLFECEGVRRDSPPSREAKQGPAPGIAVRTANTSSNGHGVAADGLAYTLDTSGPGGQAVLGYRMAAFGEYADDETASTMKARDYKDATDLVVHGTQDPCTSEGLAFALGRNNGGENALLECRPLNSMTMQGRPSDDLNPRMGSGIGDIDAPQNTITTAHHHAVSYGADVRRLTPIECERLQGFPDDHTRIPYRGKPADLCPDGPRYKAIGNSKAVPVVQWVGRRLLQELSR